MADHPMTIEGLADECERELAEDLARLGPEWSYESQEGGTGWVIDVRCGRRHMYRAIERRRLEACRRLQSQLDAGPPSLALRLAAGRLTFEPSADVWASLMSELAPEWDKAPHFIKEEDFYAKPGPARIIGRWRRAHGLERDPLNPR